MTQDGKIVWDGKFSISGNFSSVLGDQMISLGFEIAQTSNTVTLEISPVVNEPWENA